MRQLVFSIGIIILSIFVINASAAAQEISRMDYEKNEKGYWLNLGFGTNYFGPTLKLGLSYSWNGNRLTARYLKSDEFTLGSPGGGDPNDKPLLWLKETGLLYGMSLRTGSTVQSLSAGLSYVNAVNRGRNIDGRQYEQINISTVGIPLELQSRIEFTDYLGISINFFGNLNNMKTYWGGSLDLSIGYNCN